LPLLSEDLHLTQGLHNVPPIHCGPHGHKVCVNQALVIEEGLGPFAWSWQHQPWPSLDQAES
jgi:hypothetical protein